MDVSDANYQMLYEGLRMGMDFFSRNTGRVLWCYGPDFECMSQGLLDARWLQSNAERLTSDPDYHRGELDLTDALVNDVEDSLEYDFVVRDGDVGGYLWFRNAIERLLADGDVVEMTTDSVRDWAAGLGDDDLARISETRRSFERNAKALAVQQDLISSGDEERIVDLDIVQSKWVDRLAGGSEALLNEDTGEYASLDDDGTHLITMTLDPRLMLKYLFTLDGCSEGDIAKLYASRTGMDKCQVVTNRGGGVRPCDVRDAAFRLVGDGTGEVVPVRDGVLSLWTLRNCLPHVSDLNRLMLTLSLLVAEDVRQMVADGMTVDQVSEELLSACWLNNDDTLREVKEFVTDALALPDCSVWDKDSLEQAQGHTDDEER